MLPQGLLDRLQSTGAPSDPKPSGKLAGAKSPVKAPAKAAAQPEAVASLDAPASPPPADLIIAARLHLSQVQSHSLFNLSAVSDARLINRCTWFVYVHANSATAFVLKTYNIVVGLW